MANPKNKQELLASMTDGYAKLVSGSEAEILI